MKIVAIMPVRSEDWVLGLSARALLKWVDHLVILDHASTDATKRIVNEIALEHVGRVRLLEDSNPVWQEMRHRQWLLTEARELGATHIAMVDADEILTADLLPCIRDMFESIKPGEVLQLPWLCLRGSVDQVHASGIWAEQSASCGFEDDPLWHWSSGGRGGYDFHHRHPMGRSPRYFNPIPGRMGGLMHLQFVSDRRLRAKQAWYKMTEVLRWPGREPVTAVDQRYNIAVYSHAIKAAAETPDRSLKAVPAEWWAGYEDLMHHLRPDAVPWQCAKVKEAIAEHGIERFQGLDLFGVAGLADAS